MKNKISLPVKFGLLASLIALFAFMPRKDDPIDKIVATLQKWMDINPQEKIYLHMDKPYYAIGDTVWFKGYLMVGSRHQLSALSGAMYVDLINEGDSTVTALKLPVTSGMVVGNFILNDELREGNYRVRAYTQWMRNAGDAYFFDKTFTVGSAYSDNVLSKASYKYGSGNKAELTATLNYTDELGKAMANKDVRYQIVINKNVVYTKSATTDVGGNIQVGIANDSKVDLSGAYIRTVLQNNDKKTIIRDFPVKAALSQTDVQFFPESGNLVNGLASRVAFKAVGVDGLGANVTGKIVDQANAEVADITATHAGMGSFLLKPDAGKTYTAKLNFADGSTQSVALPTAVDDGFVLSIFQPNPDSILIRINASAKQLQAKPVISFLAQTGGETVFASSVNIERPMTSVWLEKKAFPAGIAQFTLFSATGEPLNERVAFIRTKDQMQLALKTSKNSYKGKERVDLQMDAKDSKGKSTIGNFSVTVVDESKAPVDESAESTIFSNVLLTSDLKGYIEKPNYYFTADNDEVNNALDNLMMTQGYRRFTWKQVLDNTAAAAKPAFEAEGLGYKMSGKVITLTGNKPVPNASIALASLTTSFLKQTTADANGRFKFDGIFLTDSIRFAMQARNGKSTNVKLILDSVPRLTLAKNRNIADIVTDIPGTMKTFIENGKKQDDIYEKTGQFDKVQRLREVRIGAKRNGQDPKIAPQGMFRIPAGAADQTLMMVDPETCPTLRMCLQRKMPAGTRFETVDGRDVIVDMRGTVLTFYMNGRRIDQPDEELEILDGAVDPADIARIDVVRTNQALINMLGSSGAGAIMIITKTPYGNRKTYEPSMVNIKPKGFNKTRNFYSPRYDRPGSNLKFPDLRTTIYWNPYVKTDAMGKAVFNFFNADGPGSYKVIVEGINADGELGRAVYKYNVEGGMVTGALTPGKAINPNAAMYATAIDTFQKKKR